MNPSSETAKELGIPQRTLDGDGLERVLGLIELGKRVLGGNLRAWLHAPNRGLGGVVPLELLDTDQGVRAVEDVLLRLEHGIYG